MYNLMKIHNEFQQAYLLVDRDVCKSVSACEVSVFKCW